MSLCKVKKLLACCLRENKITSKGIEKVGNCIKESDWFLGSFLMHGLSQRGESDMRATQLAMEPLRTKKESFFLVTVPPATFVGIKVKVFSRNGQH